MTDSKRDPLEEVRRLARELLELGEENPHALADRLMRNLDQDQNCASMQRALMRYGAGLILNDINRGVRKRTLKPVIATRSWKADVTTVDLLSQRYCVGDEWKTLGDCTTEDVLFIAGAYRERAAKNTAYAESFEELAADMQRVGASTVADLYREERRAA